jgi:hypothetical protein
MDYQIDIAPRCCVPVITGIAPRHDHVLDRTIGNNLRVVEIASAKSRQRETMRG